MGGKFYLLFVLVATAGIVSYGWAKIEESHKESNCVVSNQELANRLGGQTGGNTWCNVETACGPFVNDCLFKSCTQLWGPCGPSNNFSAIEAFGPEVCKTIKTTRNCYNPQFINILCATNYICQCVSDGAGGLVCEKNIDFHRCLKPGSTDAKNCFFKPCPK